MKKDSFSYRVTVLFLSNLLLFAMGFAYRAALSRRAGYSALGLNSLVMQVYRVIAAVCISGLNVSTAALAARLEPACLRSLFKAAFGLFCGLWSAAAVMILLFGRSIAENAIGDAGTYPTLLLMLLCIFMTGTENILRAVLMGRGTVRPCALSELCEQGVRFAAVIILLTRLEHGDDAHTVFLIMLGMVMSESVSLAFLGTSLLRITRGETLPRCVVRNLMVRSARLAFPAAMTSAASAVFASFGTILLPKLLVMYGMKGEDALAAIGGMNTVCLPQAGIPMALSAAVAANLTPAVSGMAARLEPVRGFVKRAFIKTGTACFVLCLLIFAVSGRLIPLFFACRADGSLLGFVFAYSFVGMLHSICVSVLNGLCCQRAVFITSLTGEIYGLALSLMLVPLFGLAAFPASCALGEALKLLLGFIFYDAKTKMGMEFS